ncbi:MAG: segregation/condensation protein A [Micavibrio sp.]|nr:segregation/condensation protein A [Micavibrio sp.]
MSDETFQEDQWPKGEHEEHPHDSLLLNLEGFEGPIDVLLNLARDQKVDLTKISILELVKQYLVFVERAKQIRLELAADYLVMAAWLAYLKSRLLLPKEEKGEDELSAEEMSEALAFQLRRLEAIQDVAERLFARPQLGQQVFYRGMPEGLSRSTDATYDASFYDIIQAYGDIQRRSDHSSYEIKPFNLMSPDEAVERLSRMLGKLPKKGVHTVWATLDQFLPEDLVDALMARSATASTFVASLELVKQGQVEIRQDGAFKPIYLRGKSE